jgi:hypothetical protein
MTQEDNKHNLSLLHQRPLRSFSGRMDSLLSYWILCAGANGAKNPYLHYQYIFKKNIIIDLDPKYTFCASLHQVCMYMSSMLTNWSVSSRIALNAQAGNGSLKRQNGNDWVLRITFKYEVFAVKFFNPYRTSNYSTEHTYFLRIQFQTYEATGTVPIPFALEYDPALHRVQEVDASVTVMRSLDIHFLAWAPLVMTCRHSNKIVHTTYTFFRLSRSSQFISDQKERCRRLVLMKSKK